MAVTASDRPPGAGNHVRTDAIPAVLYGAKSTEDVHGSIPDQLRDCKALAEREGWEVLSEFTDEGFSAYTGNRGPGLREAEALAVAAAAEHGTCLLVAQHSDRLARGAGDAPKAADHLGELYFRFKRQRVTIHTVQEGEIDGIRAFISGMRNTEDSHRKCAAIASGMRRHAERGRLNGGPRPYAYRYGRDGLEVVNHEAEIVRRIFKEFLAGRSITAIARGLHRDNIPTSKGGLWRGPTVSGILGNVVYIGKIHPNGDVYDGTHAGIVPTETFERVQDMLANRPNRKGGRPPKGRHLFRDGMLRCECGEAIVPRTNGGYQLYYCNGRSKLGVEHCSMPYVRRALIDNAVYRYFERVGLDVEATRAQLSDERERRLAEVEALHDQADREVGRLEGQLVRIRRDYRDGRLDADEWRSLRDEITPELDAAKAEEERLARSKLAIERNLKAADTEQNVVEMLADIRRSMAGEIQTAVGADAVRAALSRLFSDFILHPQKGARYKGQGRSELVDAGDELMIELRVREHTLVGYSDFGMYPVLRREALLPNNQYDGLPIRYASGPS
jgi:DNA invertase Pin-like site-specific DNA recombinase